MLKDPAEDGMEMGSLPANDERIEAGGICMDQTEPSGLAIVQTIDFELNPIQFNSAQFRYF